MDSLERDCERVLRVDHERDISTGAAAPANIRAAEAHRADEIVIGSRGVGRVRACWGASPTTSSIGRMPRHGDPGAHGRPTRGDAGRGGKRLLQPAQPWMTLSTWAVKNGA